MRILRSLLLILLLPASGMAQHYVFPKVPAKAANAQGFVPPNWKIIAQAQGDLDKDQRPDLALVLQCKDPRHIVHPNPDFPEMVLDSNRRMTVVAFADPAGGYARRVVDSVFVARHLYENIEDPFDTLDISKGVLRFRFVHFANMGSWSAGSETFAFRWQQGKMALIGHDQSSIHRASGESEETSRNFSTMKQQRITYNEFDAEVPRQEVWTKLPPQAIPCLGKMPEMYEFEVKE